MTRALRGVAGVKDVQIDLGNRRATVTHEGADLGSMKEAVDEAGYEVTGTV